MYRNLKLLLILLNCIFDFKKILVIFIILNIYSYRITAGSYPLSAVISSSIQMDIHVKTNVSSFICNYKSEISDTLSYLFSSKDNKYYLGENQYFVPVNSIDCHNNLMNQDMQEMFNSSKYPNIIIKIKNVNYNHNLSDKGKLYLSLIINDVEKKYYMNFEAGRRYNCIEVTGNLSVNLNDFNIIPPTKLFGLLQVSNIIDIDFLLNLKLHDPDNHSNYISIK
jgi:hypothetical protein